VSRLPGPGEEAPEEARLLAAAASGERAALRWLLDEVAPVVYGFIFARVGGNDAIAEDLLQDTLLEAVRSAHGFRGEASASTFLCAIARRRLARHYEAERKAALARSRLHVVEGQPRPTPDHALDTGLERRDEVIRALGRLSPLHRQVLVLKYLDARSVEQIADELGRSRVQVQSLLQRAREALRRELGGEDA
jgi:RNA polymerase sigma-70 factor (ECF subfamily)